VAELVRRYWILGIECTLLEIEKLGYFLERSVDILKLDNKFEFRFQANKFGPYSVRLSHLLDSLDGSYLHCDKRLSDASPFDIIWFDDAKADRVAAYLTTPEARVFRPALETTAELIDGFESPLGMELLATVDWLIERNGVKPITADIRDALKRWPGGANAAARKQRLFDDRLIGLALDRLSHYSAQ
jgi:hypothetical protein